MFIKSEPGDISDHVPWDQQLLEELMIQLRELPESVPFLAPVDPILVPQYCKVIANPIDLGTIQQKLNDRLYIDPWAFIDDIHLLFKNAYKFNRKTSIIYRFCGKVRLELSLLICIFSINVSYLFKLSTFFDSKTNGIMLRLGYCCGQKYRFQPKVLPCFGKPACKISKGGKYYKNNDR